MFINSSLLFFKNNFITIDRVSEIAQKYAKIVSVAVTIFGALTVFYYICCRYKAEKLAIEESVIPPHISPVSPDPIKLSLNKKTDSKSLNPDKKDPIKKVDQASGIALLPNETQVTTKKEVSQIQRKGFHNGGTNCFIAAALHCFVSIRPFLSCDASNLPPEIQETSQLILNLLDKVIGGKEGSNEELDEIKGKLGINGMGDSREAVLLLAPFLGIDSIKIYHNDQWFKSMNPMNLNEHHNPNMIKNEHEKDCYIYKFPLSDQNGEKLNFLLLNRYMLSDNLSNRISIDFPQRIQVPVANQKDHFDEYELMATAQSLGGHAIAYSKEKENWVKYDDDKISMISQEEAKKEISKNSMILVYHLSKSV